MEPLLEIPTVSGGIDRPFWSVMIPTYNPSDLLEETLRSVLDQDPGAGVMQIAIVDDASTTTRAEEIIRRLAPGRIEYHRQPRNIGLAGNWNTCVELSRGQWVHILHQDDVILPGFYERLGHPARLEPRIGAIFCRHLCIDGEGRKLWESQAEREHPGLLDGWLERLCIQQSIQCPSIVVKRKAYERLGGFRTDLCYALDWEMWVRIAAHYPVWYEPTFLACYRWHPRNESARLIRNGLDLDDLRKAIELNIQHVPAHARNALRSRAISLIVDRALSEATQLMGSGDRCASLKRVRAAYRIDPSWRLKQLQLKYYKWALKNWVSSLLTRCYQRCRMPVR
jgi:glycosyltransferase involved in cell wall biosynthesis